MSPLSEVRARLTVLEKNRLVDGLLLASMPLGFLLFGAFLLFRFSPGAFGVHMAIIAAVLRFGVARENSRAVPAERDVHVSAEGVRVDGELIPRASIAEGSYQPRLREPSTIRLFDRRKRIVFEARAESEEQAQAMLRALGLDASQKRAEFRVAGRFAGPGAQGGMAALAMIGVLATRFFLETGPGPFFALLAVLGLLAVIPSTMTVGVDGVLVRWLWQRRFIPMAEIVAAHAEGETAIRLELEGGREELIPIVSRKRRGGVFTERRDMILARIREAKESHRSPTTGADVAALVGRGTRSLDEWKKALSSLTADNASYRQAALRDEDLWRLVEDPRASEDARAAAALLLRRGLDEPGRARVRIAAEATASPKLRVALEAATAPGDEVALEALDELDVTPLRAAGAGGR